MLGELCNIYVDSHTCNYILNLFFSFCLGLTVKQVSEARRLCINATVINGVDGEFQKQGYYATVRRWGMGRFRSQETYVTMRQCQGGGWGASEVRIICDNATAQRGWMGSFRSKDNMRQRDCAKGVDREFQKEGDYATTRLCEGGGWGDSEVRTFRSKDTTRQRDCAKGVDGEFQKEGDNATV